MANCSLDGKLLSTRTERFDFLFGWFLLTLIKNFVASGRVPKELANLTNLVNLSLYENQLQVPDGAPLDSDGDMDYDSREAVAAFQACLN